MINELLHALIEAMPADQRPDLEDQAQMIRALLVPDDQFSIEEFIAGEVARALAD